MTATEYNRDVYDRIWAQMSDFIRYNPGARHRRRHVFELLGRCRFDSLLDVGCGNAELLRLVDERWPGRRLAGVDLSAAVVEQNARRLPHIQFHSKDLVVEPLPGGFDVVLCSEVIEHLDDPAAAVARLGAAVKPGGHLIITCPTGKVWPTEKHFGHVRHPTPGDLKDWAARAGLSVVDVVAWGFPVYSFTKWAQNINPEAALAAFAGERPYAMPQIAISTGLWLANFLNLRSSPWGVQLFALLQRPSQ
ncbi:MAG TPA: class I SAM-dependent methyltransferase [Myxococcota bacterium]|jgi:SAM-dependent methyltransferase